MLHLQPPRLRRGSPAPGPGNTAATAVGRQALAYAIAAALLAAMVMAPAACPR